MKEVKSLGYPLNSFSPVYLQKENATHCSIFTVVCNKFLWKRGERTQEEIYSIKVNDAFKRSLNSAILSCESKMESFYFTRIVAYSCMLD